MNFIGYLSSIFKCVLLLLTICYLAWALFLILSTNILKYYRYATSGVTTITPDNCNKFRILLGTMYKNTSILIKVKYFDINKTVTNKYICTTTHIFIEEKGCEISLFGHTLDDDLEYTIVELSDGDYIYISPFGKTTIYNYNKNNGVCIKQVIIKRVK